jgi:hypothetical protein
MTVRRPLESNTGRGPESRPDDDVQEDVHGSGRRRGDERGGHEAEGEEEQAEKAEMEADRPRTTSSGPTRRTGASGTATPIRMVAKYKFRS